MRLMPTFSQPSSAARVRFAACLLRAVLPINPSRRAAPPGIRCCPISSPYQRREPDETRQNIIGADYEGNRRNHGINESRVSQIHKTALEKMAALHSTGIHSTQALV